MTFPGITRRPLEGDHFHVIVIGGGISGVAIARECARAGRRTLLVEQHDFAAGTTSRSTRIMHGGLRYLEHADIRLVRESLRERQRLLLERPHLAHPVHFLLALDQNSRRSALAVRTGLWLYRRLGGAGLRADSSQADQNKLERLLDAGRRWSIFSFEDAQCEFPERLVAEWLVEAIEAGGGWGHHTPRPSRVPPPRRPPAGGVRGPAEREEKGGGGTRVLHSTPPRGERRCRRFPP